MDSLFLELILNCIQQFYTVTAHVSHASHVLMCLPPYNFVTLLASQINRILGPFWVLDWQCFNPNRATIEWPIMNKAFEVASSSGRKRRLNSEQWKLKKTLSGHRLNVMQATVALAMYWTEFEVVWDYRGRITIKLQRFIRTKLRD